MGGGAGLAQAGLGRLGAGFWKGVGGGKRTAGYESTRAAFLERINDFGTEALLALLFMNRTRKALNLPNGRWLLISDVLPPSTGA